jgi:phospholipid transport system substrate-binding protein
MPVSRRLILALPLAAGGLAHRAAAAAGGDPAVATVSQFYAGLLAVMKAAKTLSFDQRFARLSPLIMQAFDLGLMARIAVGPTWPRLTPDQQQRITQAFIRFTVSEYAGRFDGYSGERFVVEPAAQSNPAGVIVQSRLVKSDGDSVMLNYLLHHTASGEWRIIDVYLKGTISELATRRSEFSGVLQQSGPDGLVQVLDQRSASLRTG